MCLSVIYGGGVWETERKIEKGVVVVGEGS